MDENGTVDVCGALLFPLFALLSAGSGSPAVPAVPGMGVVIFFPVPRIRQFVFKRKWERLFCPGGPPVILPD